jgi:hypothetical protein
MNEDADLVLLGQRIAHRTERLEAIIDNIGALEALVRIVPQGMTLGEALVGGYVSVLEVVESIQAVPDLRQ